MKQRTRADYRTVDRDSLCPVTKAGHIPTTMERMEDGNHLRFHVCKNCGDAIR